jgi:hypothetical protein
MIAKIGFNIYQDYTQHLTEDDDYDYGVALDVLNKELKELVDKDELVFTYDGKQVEIVLPVEMHDTGNIFGEEDYDGPCWDGVDIPCEIDCDPYDFDSSKLRVKKCPYYFDAKCILH